MTFTPDYDGTSVDDESLAQIRSKASNVEEGFPTRSDKRSTRKDARRAERKKTRQLERCEKIAEEHGAECLNGGCLA